MVSESTIVPLELRRARSEVGHVLTGVCVPYGKTSRKVGYPKGERFLAGALASAPAAAEKIRLTDSHVEGEMRRPAGVATDLCEAEEGLVGTFRFYDTPEGRGAWENVVEGTYGGLSVGFMPIREAIGADGAREIVEARLFHVSLVDEPAYDDAKVLTVRHAFPKATAAQLERTWPDFSSAPDEADIVRLGYETR